MLFLLTRLVHESRQFLRDLISVYLYVSNRTKKKFRQCIRYWEHFLKTSLPSKEDLHKMRASMNSYLGILQHYRSYAIRKKALLEGEPKGFFKYGYLKNIKQKSMMFYLYKQYR